MTEMTRETFLEAVKRVAAEIGHTPSRKEFLRHESVPTSRLYALFPDCGWNDVLALAGFAKPVPETDRNVLSNDDLLAEFHRVVKELNGIPTWAQLTAHSTFGTRAIQKRFGGVKGTLNSYRSWLRAREPESPLLALIPDPSSMKPEGRRRTTATAENGKPNIAAAHVASSRPRPAAKPTAPLPAIDSPVSIKDDETQYGAPIDFRGLRHAPINEQGVVYLFGMVSRELGFLVEAIHTAYPDCEAKRCVDKKRDRWQRVRIEFEFKSRNFLEHAHDATKCDLIVCWLHDWKECPLEVVELRKVIAELPS